MTYNENIERIFNDDVRDKKRTGRGAFNKTGKGVKHVMRGIKTPYDFMKTKERKKLNGEVKVTNMYETIIDREEFLLKDEKTQKAMLIRWRELYNNQKIMDEMGLKSSGAFHTIITRLDIPKKNKHMTRKSKTIETEPKENKKALATVEQMPETPPIVNNFVQQQPVKLITNGLHVEYNGIFSSEQINKILTKLQLLVEGEDNEFNIELRISESEKKEAKKDLATS